MFSKLKFTLPLLIFFGIGCYNKQIINLDPSSSFTHPNTGIFLPLKIGGLERIKTFKYPKEELGISAKYQNADLIKASIYIYNAGLKKILPGIEDGYTESYFNQTLQEIIKMQTMGYYENVKNEKREVLDFLIKGYNLKAFHCRLSFEEGGINLYSHVFISSFMNHFIKIRYTYPKSLEDEGKKQWENVISVFNSGKNCFDYISLLPVLESKKGIEDRNDHALICAEYLSNNEYSPNDINWKICNSFLLNWMENTPNFGFTINPYSASLMDDGEGLFTIYLAFYAKMSIEEMYSSDIDLQVESFKSLFNYCYNKNINIDSFVNLSKLKEVFNRGEERSLFKEDDS